MSIDSSISACGDVKEIAKGGQKTVFSAVHPSFGPVVLKLGHYPHSAALERIRREVGLLANVKSCYYPRHFGFEVEPEGRRFLIIEERIFGKPLADCMSNFNDESKIISLLKLLIQGLNLLWSQRVVHRDIKPQNIIIRDSGEPVIIDLGIARLLEFSSLTLAGAPIGPCTMAYASPEQLKNQKSIIDTRSDFFVLGIVLLELHLGFHPFDPKRVQAGDNIPENILAGRYVRPTATVSAEFKTLITRLLQVEPYLRFKNPQAFGSYVSDNWR